MIANKKSYEIKWQCGHAVERTFYFKAEDRLRAEHDHRFQTLFQQVSGNDPSNTMLEISIRDSHVFSLHVIEPY